LKLLGGYADIAIGVIAVVSAAPDAVADTAAESAAVAASSVVENDMGGISMRATAAAVLTVKAGVLTVKGSVVADMV